MTDVRTPPEATPASGKQRQLPRGLPVFAVIAVRDLAFLAGGAAAPTRASCRDVEKNDNASFLPGSAESTKVCTSREVRQGRERARLHRAAPRRRPDRRGQGRVATRATGVVARHRGRGHQRDDPAADLRRRHHAGRVHPAGLQAGRQGHPVAEARRCREAASSRPPKRGLPAGLQIYPGRARPACTWRRSRRLLRHRQHAASLRRGAGGDRHPAVRLPLPGAVDLPDRVRRPGSRAVRRWSSTSWPSTTCSP